MKLAGYIGIFCAIVLHVGFLLFGGVFFPDENKSHGSTQQVDLLAPDAPVEKEKPKDPPPEEQQEIKPEDEKAPDASEVIRKMDQPSNAAPALELTSLSAIEAALNGQGGNSDFAEAVGFKSGGVVGGTGKGGTLQENADSAFGLSEIDQKPRAVFQAAPVYPAEMRSKKLEGAVSVMFVVDASGKVTQQRVEKSVHPAFEKPAMDAVKQWKFEPAIKGGQRVACKMRVSVRFQLGQ